MSKMRSLVGPIILLIFGPHLCPLFAYADAEFIHPGLVHQYLLTCRGPLTVNSIFHTQTDLDRIKNGVANKSEPWYLAFLNMSGDPLASSSYEMKSPLTYATHNATGSSPEKTDISSDSVAAVLNALM
jgi:hypothetical protein